MSGAKRTIVLDTSAYSAYNKGDGRVKRWFVPSTDFIMPLIVVGELRAGFAAGNKQKENETLLEFFIALPGVRLASITDATTKYYASTFAHLRRSGKAVNGNDLWIAALTMEHDARLLTTDTDFERIDSLRLVDINK